MNESWHSNYLVKFRQAGNITQNIFLQFQIIAIYEVRLADLDGSVNSNSEKLPHKSATHTGSIMVNCAIFGGSKL